MVWSDGMKNVKVKLKRICILIIILMFIFVGCKNQEISGNPEELNEVEISMEESDKNIRDYALKISYIESEIIIDQEVEIGLNL